MVSVVPQISKPQPCAVLDEEEDDENDLVQLSSAKILIETLKKKNECRTEI